MFCFKNVYHGNCYIRQWWSMSTVKFRYKYSLYLRISSRIIITVVTSSGIHVLNCGNHYNPVELKLSNGVKMKNIYSGSMLDSRYIFLSDN